MTLHPRGLFLAPDSVYLCRDFVLYECERIRETIYFKTSGKKSVGENPLGFNKGDRIAISRGTNRVMFGHGF